MKENATGKIVVKVNLPIAFGEALLDSLTEYDRGQITDELRRRGIDLSNIWKSLRSLGKQTLVQVETEEHDIRVWLE